MKIAVVSDGRGYSLRRAVLDGLAAQGHEVVDRGVHQRVIEAGFVATEAIRMQLVERAILISASALSTSLMVNRIDGIHAGVGFDTYDARRGGENGMNLVCLSFDLTPVEAVDIVNAFAGARPLHHATLRSEPARAVVAA